MLFHSFAFISQFKSLVDKCTQVAKQHLTEDFFIFQKLIRKDGDYHTSRIIEGKGMQANQNMQPKKKHKKSGLANKVKVEVKKGSNYTEIRKWKDCFS